MKKIFIQANCQGQAIKTIINSVPRLKEIFAIYELRAIHLWNDTDKELVFNSIKECDIYLHQPISKYFREYSSENLKMYLKKGSISISFPVIYFSGYNPETVYLKNKEKKKIALYFDYHDINLIKMYLDGRSIDEVYSTLNDSNLYTYEFIRNNIEKSFHELEQREKNLDIAISSYIKQNLQQGNKLFFSMNHPINDVLCELVNRILYQLSIDPLSKDEKLLFPPELLGRSNLYLYKSIASFLNLPYKKSIKIDAVDLSLKEMIENYFKSYKDNEEILKFNLELYNDFQ